MLFVTRCWGSFAFYSKAAGLIFPIYRSVTNYINSVKCKSYINMHKYNGKCHKTCENMQGNWIFIVRDKRSGIITGLHLAHVIQMLLRFVGSAGTRPRRNCVNESVAAEKSPHYSRITRVRYLLRADERMLWTRRFVLAVDFQPVYNCDYAARRVLYLPASASTPLISAPLPRYTFQNLQIIFAYLIEFTPISFSKKWICSWATEVHKLLTAYNRLYCVQLSFTLL